jgi:hypothetical protein
VRAKASRRGATTLRGSSPISDRLFSILWRVDKTLVGQRAKLDFYRVVYSGGRLLTLLGMFCVAAGVIHFWYRETRATPLLAGGK